MPDARRRELLLAGQLESDGPPGGEHQVADDVLDQHLLLAAEASADARLDHADALHRDAEERCQHAADVERHLRRRANHEPLVLVEPPVRHVRLDRAVLDALQLEGLLEDLLGLRECCVDVGGAAFDVRREVAQGIRDADRVGLVVDHRGAVLHRLGRVEHCRQDLVGDLDPAACLFGELRRLGGDRCDPVADVPDLVVEADLVPGVGVRPALAGGGVLHRAGCCR